MQRFVRSELCRQIVEDEPAVLLCVDQNETGMFYLQCELAKMQNGTSQTFCVADVGDRERMQVSSEDVNQAGRPRG
jgi:FlaA1/EpsC-like NDP-sugar epimerase